MKIVTAALALLVFVTVPVSAQTLSSGKPDLQWKSFVWYERTNSGPDITPAPSGPEIADTSLWKHSASPGEFVVESVFKNIGAKAIKSITLDVIFRDTLTEQEFLAYNFRFEKQIKPKQTKLLSHKIRKERDPYNFRPPAPDKDLRARTGRCGHTEYFWKLTKPQFSLTAGKVMKRRDDPYALSQSPCYYVAYVTLVEYADGSTWQP